MLIDGRAISYRYQSAPGDAQALSGVDISIGRGELVAVLGCNGSGKSTLARHLNALLPLQGGSLSVAGIDVSDETDVWRLRRMCGMVFQNPDNQFVSSILSEDIAFGLQNYGVADSEIPAKTAAALKLVGLEGFEERSTHLLSGGQKQRAALAGVLALEPDILIFDEATSMLDPEGRRQVLDMIEQLRGAGKTVIMITHYVDEAVSADRVLLLGGGRLLADGAPRVILTDRELLRRAGLEPPMPVALYYGLRDAGVVLPSCPLTNKELADEICQLM